MTTNSKKENWFSSPIHMVMWDEHEKHSQKIIKEITRLKKIVPSNSRSSINGWQSVKNLYEYEFVTEFLNYVTVPITQYLLDLQLDLSRHNLIISQMWANVNGINSYNKSHQHPDSFISGVYYLTSPKNSGNIVFEDPRNPWCILQGSYTELNYFSATEVQYEPSPGLLILFPSYLSHRVEINNNKDDRISISFNVSLLKK
jgi:uncharacterized protein (TIGR02466 family)